MVIDVGRVKHLGDLMHKSIASNGSAVTSNWRLAADGLTNVIWSPESASSVSYGSNSNEVSYVNAPGASSLVSRADHVHRGVTSISHASNTYTGPVTLETEGSLYIVKPSANTYRLGSTAQGGAGGGGSSGALVLLEQQTASNSATLDFAACITSTYDDYLIRLISVLPATAGANLNVRVSTDGGSTYDTSTNYYGAFLYGPNTGSSGTVQTNTATSFPIFVSVDNTASRGGVAGEMGLFNPLDTSVPTTATFRVYAAQAAAVFVGSGMGLWFSNTAVNAIRFLMSSGNIASGIIRFYGVVK